jgi:dTDP-glucose 4,6-dehydratase
LRILVAGGAGFIGSNFVRQIVDGQFPGIATLSVIDKLTYAGTLTNLDMLPKNSFQFIHGDIRDYELIKSLVKKHDVIINFAAESHVDRSIKNAKDFIETNVLGTQNLLDCSMKTRGITYIQISTDEVYGSINEGSWDENYPLLPNSPYSASKASADLIARSYYKTFGLDVRITRSSNNYGPHQFPEKIIPLFITNIIDGKKVPLFGNGLNRRDWLHVDDHCRGIYAVLASGKAGEIYNIGGGTEITNKELTTLILNKMGKDFTDIDFVPDRLGHDFRYSISINKITSELGYKPQVKFEAGIDKTIAWYIENERWWRPLK